MLNENSELTNVSETSFSKRDITLANNTTLSLRLNGTEYESDAVIEDSTLSEENLSNVTIDGVKMGKMVLISKYSYGTGTRFSLRQQTEREKVLEEINTELLQAQKALAEIYELVLSSNA